MLHVLEYYLELALLIKIPGILNISTHVVVSSLYSCPQTLYLFIPKMDIKFRILRWGITILCLLQFVMTNLKEFWERLVPGQICKMVLHLLITSTLNCYELHNITNLSIIGRVLFSFGSLHTLERLSSENL